MSYPIEASEAPRSRPGTVMFARLLAFAIAALLVVAGIGIIVTLSDLRLTVSGSNSQNLTDADLTRVQHIFEAVVGVLVALLVAAQLTVAFLLSAPRNGARIMAWIVDGLVVLCCGCGLGNAVLQGSGNRQATSGNASVEVSTAGIPTGLDILVSVSLLFAVLAALTLVVLLALPASNDYFRPAPVMWTPTSWSGSPPSGGPQYPQPGAQPPGPQPTWQPPTLPPIGAPPPPTTPPGAPPPPGVPPPPGAPPGALPPPGVPPPPAAPPGAPQPPSDQPLPPPHVSPPDDRLRPPPPPTDPTAPPSDQP